MSILARILIIGVLVIVTAGATLQTVNILHDKQVIRNEIAAKQAAQEQKAASSSVQNIAVSQTTKSSTGTTNTTKKTTSTTATTQSNTNTMAQVALHNTATNCWIVISSRIYNVSSFMNQHPGGVGAITPYCGKEATVAFQTHGHSGGSNHSAYAYSLLASYFVAPLSTGTTASTQTTQSQVMGTIQSKGFVVGDTIKTLSTLKVRSTANGVLLGTQSIGAQGTIIAGPISAGGYVWWKVNFASGVDGWVAENYIQASTQTTQQTTQQTQTTTIATTTTQIQQQLPLPPPTTVTSSGYTAAQVATHNSQGDCWIIISGRIYNVTSFISIHPGGATAIASRCGNDVTTFFTTNVSGGHAHSAYAQSLLPTYYVGDVGTTQPIQPIQPITTSYTVSVTKTGTGSGTVSGNVISCGSTCSGTIAAGTTITLSASAGSGSTFTGWSGACSGTGSCMMVVNSSVSVVANFNVATVVVPPPTTSSGYNTAQVAAHNSQGDCWIIISGRVYNVTSFISVHPGGVNAIASRCGNDVTTFFTTNVSGGHAHSAYAQSLLPTYYVGDVTTTTVVQPPPTSTSTTPVTPPTTTGGSTTYTVHVTSAGNYDVTNLTLHVGDKINFIYTPPVSGEVKISFSPTGISTVTLDSEFTSRTRTFSTAGTWTFKAQDHSGNQGTVTVQ